MKKTPVFERTHFREVFYETCFSDLPASFSGFRLAFLTDLHAVRLSEGNGDIAESVLRNGADALLVGGDMILAKPGKKMDYEPIREIFSRVAGRIPVYYGEGNHEKRILEEREDYPGWQEAFEGLLKEYGVRSLDNETASLQRNGEEIRISGLGLGKEQYRHGSKRPLPEGFFRDRLGEKSGFTILLLHSPAYFEEAADWGADLTLSGHYHGGTIRLGKVGLMTPQFVFFEKKVQGLFENGEKKLIVSAGLGTHSVNLRMWNPPELVFVTLMKKG